MAFLDKDGLTYLWSKIKSLIPNNSNLINGSKNGSLRSVNSAAEDATYTIGEYAFAEGEATKASGTYSHAEGYYTTASGTYSHAEGRYTIAASADQHAQGKYNIEDSNNTYAHIVGNGTSADNRSNAHTLDWSGNAWFAGKISQDGTPTDANDLATKVYVDSAIPDVSTKANNSEVVHLDGDEIITGTKLFNSSSGINIGSSGGVNILAFQTPDPKELRSDLFLTPFSADGTELQEIRLNGVTIVEENEDVANKKYVDDALANASGDSSVFVAIYGTTTLSEIIAAKNSGKLVIAKKQVPINIDKVEKFAILMQVYNVKDTMPRTAYFICSNSNGGEQWTVEHDGTWSSSEIVFLSKIGGTMTGQLIANDNTSYTTSQVRNISLQTSVPSSIPNGSIVGVYSI